MRLHILCWIGAFVSIDIAEGQQLEPHWARLVNAKSITCTFRPGASANWSEGSPAMQLNEFSSTGLLIIRSIDIPNRTAIYWGNVGDVAVVASATSFALHFLERTDTGGLNTTTVFSTAKGGRHIAVHSRHAVILGQPLPSQFHGLCDVVN